LFCCGLVCTMPVLFLSIYYHPYSSWKFILVCFFANNNVDWLMDPCILYHKVVMVLHASIISESEVSIMVLYLLCSPRYTAVWIKHCSKSMSVIKVATLKNMDDAVHSSYHLKRSIHCSPLSAMLNLLHMQQYESRTVWKAPL